MLGHLCHLQRGSHLEIVTLDGGHRPERTQLDSPRKDYQAAILELLSGEAADLVFQAGASDSEDLEAIFRNLRLLLDARLHPMEYRTQLYRATQRRGESVLSYAFSLRQLTMKAFPEEESAQTD